MTTLEVLQAYLHVSVKLDGQARPSNASRLGWRRSAAWRLRAPPDFSRIHIRDTASDSDIASDMVSHQDSEKLGQYYGDSN